MNVASGGKSRIALIVAFFFLGGCMSGTVTDSGGIKKYTCFYMNTYVTISVPAGTDEVIVEEGFAIIKKWDEIITSGRGESGFSKTLEPLIRPALKIAEITYGKYDPTIYPVTKLWGIYGDNWRLPENREIKQSLKNVGWQKIKLTAHGVIVPEDMYFDFGGFGKGWVVDKAVEFLQASGVTEGIVDAGGDLKVWGDRVWKIGVKNPYGEGLSAVIRVRNKAVATSGDYENCFIDKMKIYHHIIDPATGRPAESGVNSVTVITDNCAASDGIATGLFVMGKDGIKKMEEFGFECIMISKDERYSSAGLEIKWLSYDKK